jgi:hypothetical protein
MHVREEWDGDRGAEQQVAQSRDDTATLSAVTKGVMFSQVVTLRVVAAFLFLQHGTARLLHAPHVAAWATGVLARL